MDATMNEATADYIYRGGGRFQSLRETQTLGKRDGDRQTTERVRL